MSLSRPPTEEEVREKLNLSPSEYGKLLKQTQPVVFVPMDGKNYDQEIVMNHHH